MDSKDFLDMPDSTPDWKIKLRSLVNYHIDTNLRVEMLNKYDQKEIGLTHTSNPAHIKLSDTGDVILGANENTSITLNNEYSTVNMRAEATNIRSKKLNLMLDLDGFRINNNILNPLLYILSQAHIDKQDGLGLELNGTVNRFVEKQVDENGDITEAGKWIKEDISIAPFINSQDALEYKTLLSKIVFGGERT